MIKKLGFMMFLCLPVVCLAQGNIGNGSDDKEFGFDSAWFLGPKKTIKVCYDKSPGFMATPEKIETSIKNAFLTWSQYIKDKKIDSAIYKKANEDWRIFHALRDERPTPADYESFLGLIPATQIQLEICGSKDSDRTKYDLMFYFGSKNLMVEKDLLQYTNPKAFAKRESYSAKDRWGAGYIFVAEYDTAAKKSINWNLSGFLNSVVMHEVGHVLGCNHVEGTIMDDVALVNAIDLANGFDISKMTLADLTRPTGSTHFDRIDGSRELFICKTCALKLSGTYPFVDTRTGLLEASLKLLMGRPVNGANVKVQMQQNSTSIGTLLIEDQAGSVELKYTLRSDPVSFSSGSKIFKVQNDPRGLFYLSGGSGSTQNADLVTADGKTVSITIARNVSTDETTYNRVLIYIPIGARGLFPLFGGAFREE